MKKINQNNKLYPTKLNKIHNAPKQLYIEGNTSILNSHCISVVGSRNFTQYGEKCCKEMVEGLVKYGLTIVSGMAIGIDSIAHNSAIKAGGNTIAVLPSGLNNIYPKANKDLYNRILQSNGAVITEYSPQTEADYNKFLERNRIVAGLSIATLVIEAAHRSGTTVTASFAMEEKKEVYCIPGNINRPKSIGTNELIKQGAKLVTCAEDIVKNYDFLKRIELEKEKNVFNSEIDRLEEEYKNIYSLINDKPLNINEIAKLSKENIKEVAQKLTMLELKGIIKNVSGQRYIKEDF